MPVKILASADGQNFVMLSAKDLGISDAQILGALQKEKSPHTPLKEKATSKTPISPLDLFGEPVVEKQGKQKCPYAEVYAIAKRYFPHWNFRATTDKRNRKIAKLWRANNQSTFVFDELFRMTQESDFLNERNGHIFKGKMDLSWVIANSDKILSGKYSNEAMSWALEANKVEAIVIGEGKQKINPHNFKLVGTDEISGLPRYIRHETK